MFALSHRLLPTIQYVVQSATADISPPRVPLSHPLRQLPQRQTPETIDYCLLLRHLGRTRLKDLTILRRCRTRGWILRGWARHRSSFTAEHNTHRLNNYRPIMSWMKRCSFSAHHKTRNVEDSTIMLTGLTMNLPVVTHQHPRYPTLRLNHSVATFHRVLTDSSSFQVQACWLGRDPWDHLHNSHL